MGLSTELISQFVKVTKDDSKPRGESLVHGTIVKIDDAEYVRLDGSDLLTPVESTAETENGERVTVSIKDHCATVTGNISSPSARIGTVNSVVATVDAQNNTIIQMNNTIDQQNNLITQIDNAVNQQGNTIVQINNKVTQQENSITQIGNTVSQQGNTITQHGNSITQINSEIEERDSDISTLKSTVQTHQSNISTLQSNVQTQSSNISTLQSTVQTQGSNISTLDSTVRTHSSDIQIINSAFTINDGNVTGLNSVVTNSLEAKFANIDFANIGELAVKKIFADSGIIKDLVVDNHHITGELVGVTIKGDLIDANTIVADKLVVRGEDGILYKLNTTANLNEYGEPLDPEEQNEYNTLNGSVIAAKSITATKVRVEDLVAFDATIGGFNITESALYSGVKSSAGNTTRGIYLDKNGQLAVGDVDNFMKYYLDDSGEYRLAISASSLLLSASGKNLDTELSDLGSSIKNTNDYVNQKADSVISQILDKISMLVTDSEGTSLMTQTSDGWTFRTTDIQNAINSTSEDLQELVEKASDVDSAITILQQSVEDLGTIAEYVKIGTYEGEPCIELGETDSDFKLRITNTKIMFLEGSNAPAYMNDESLFITKAVIEEELQQGNFIWRVRSNGNLGLSWIGE